MVRAATKHDDQSNDEQTEDSDNFHGGKDEFRFTVYTNGEDVQGDDDQDDDCDPDRRRDLAFCIPEVDDQSGSRDFGAESDGVLVPVIPPSGSSVVANRNL